MIFICVVLSFVLPFNFILNFAHDDSFFYIKTAENFSKGLGSTFDGVNPTNGYHPLYFLTLVIIFIIPEYLFNASPETLYRLVFSLHTVLIIFISFFVFKSLKLILKEKFNNIFISILFLLLASFVFIRDYGLESHLAILFLSIFLYIKSKELTGEGEYPIIKSILLSLIFLSRTDFVFSLIPFVLTTDVYLSHEKKRYSNYSVSILLFTVLLYYTSNYIFFGHLETVSGKLLNGFPRFLFVSNIKTLITDPAKLYNQFARIIFLIVSFVVFTLYFFKKGKEQEKVRKYLVLIFAMGAGSLFFTLIHLCFNVYSIREWYMTLPVFVSIIMISLVFSEIKYLNVVSVILAIVLFIGVFYGSRIGNYKYNYGYKYAKELNKIIPKDDIIYQVDYCGVTAFFSDRKIINGDGLINSFEYTDYLKAGKIGEYMKMKNVKYYSTYSQSNLLRDSVYTDDNFSDKVEGKVFVFPKSSLVMEMPFIWNHMAFDLEGKWYLFKFK